MASPWPLKDEFISNSDRDRDKAPWHRLENLPTPFVEQDARPSQPWLPGFWIRFPYRGLGMWLLALLGTIAAAMILFTAMECLLIIGMSEYSLRQAGNSATTTSCLWLIDWHHTSSLELGHLEVEDTGSGDWGVNNLANGSFLRYTTLYKDTDKCNGKIKVQTCDLQGGIAKFPVRMDGKTVELQGTWKDDKFIERKYMLPADLVMPVSGDILGGFSMIAKSLYESQAFMRFTGATGYDVSSTGLPATQYLTMNGTTPGCGDRWDNPMEDIIELTRDIGFRASLQYAKYNTTDKQKVEYDSGTTTLVYVTNYEKMWIAIAVSLVGIFAVLPTFWGWWELGRDVSLNPLEIANAFGTVGQESHIMRNVYPNQNVGGIVNAVNDIGPVGYGAWEMSDGVVRLGFAGAGLSTYLEPFEGYADEKNRVVIHPLCSQPKA
ncbi:hypothetical protein FAGAP_4221 [Fusarium agapanthi]|uniref:Uncharacterized protein n=1 Tax=Fusarium agapanthi TaxID=1803897 RepID=A0A9P5BJ46_9HYPO|nr:hypothetical protein FAGAP_4221 [Fusarium agapanthi]